ncbi:MAG TPA: ABC transporter permease [Burkholderiales bacterium]|nr:ABC transporter permease [Burkholderiales bacterium]
MTSLPRALCIAAYTVLEARRARLLWLLVGVLAGLAVATGFVSALALTETARVRIGFFASASRVALVLVLCLHVTFSALREHNDRSMELTLALALPRGAYYLGKLLGYCAVGVTAAALATVALALSTAPGTALAWGCSLALELILVVCVTMFAATALRQAASVVCLSLGFYLLARSIAAVQLMSHSQLLDPAAWSARLSSGTAELLALLLPDLSRFTLTDWLLPEAPTIDLLYPAMQTAIYAALLAVAGILELQRTSL